MDPLRRCFVISPIGEEGSEVREHADDVFDFIIKPAMDECGIEAFRSDHLKEPGTITDQMFRELMSDLCIAVCTGRNPNVFYELAIAQAAARPVIILMRKGEELPFDIEHLRCVYYDLRPRPLRDGTYRKEIVQHVRGLEAADWQVSPPFGASTPLSLDAPQSGYGSTSGSLDFFDASSAFSSLREWSTSVQHTTHEFDLMDLVPLGWECSDHVREAFAEKAAEGCRIRLLTAHPENPVLAEAYASGLSVVSPEEAHATLAKTSRFFAELASRSDNIEYRQLRQGLVHVQLTRLDDHATVIPLLHSRHVEFLPLLRVPVGHALYTAVAHEFDQLWANAVPVTD